MSPQWSTKHPCLYKFFICFLYALPIIFSFFTTFLITTSGEDNFQGAGNLSNNNPINVIQDAKNAFEFNSRITDVYAWSVIDFYDYQFKFGPDIIFRLIDVIMISTVFYLSTYLVLNCKPKLQIKDALIFCSIFITFIVTPFGYSFYREFSMIHNYVPLALITLLFSIPYLKLLTNKATTKHSPIFTIYMFIISILFGMSATITPLAFLVTVIIYFIINHKCRHTKLPLWFYIGIIGTIFGFLICWFTGSGISHYTDTSTTANTFDYIPLNTIFTSIPKLIFHIIYNFGLVFGPLVIIFIICLPFLKNRRQLFSKLHLAHLSRTTINFILVFSIFIIVHTIGASLIKSPPRLLIPAYLAGLIIIFKIFVSHFKFNSLFAASITTVTFTIVIIHGILLVKYNIEMSEVLNNIKTSKETIICIEPTDTKPTRIPLIDLSQANMIVDWGQPEPIVNKQIISCE